jgi:monoamine oxidase
VEPVNAPGDASATDVLIVGGGLAGLTAAEALDRAGLGVTVAEARSFVGGRTMSIAPGELGEGAWFDVGATWHWDDQPLMQALAADTGTPVFPQYRDGLAVVDEHADQPPERVDVPAPSPAEFRFSGGAQAFCQRLADRLSERSTVLLDTNVVAVEDGADGVTANLIGSDGTGRDLRASYAVVAVPPRLAVENIAFTPDLPEELVDVMRRTPTWMATSLKCVAVYESAFWREDGLSGLAFSSAGPLREVHDACNEDGSLAGLWGFVSPDHAYRDLTFDERREQVFAHLGKMFGPVAADPLRYFERDWSTDPLTNDEVFVMPRDLLRLGHPSYAQPLWSGRLVWAGTETDPDGGGHMEGAVASGRRAARSVLDAARR